MSTRTEAILAFFSIEDDTQPTEAHAEALKGLKSIDELTDDEDDDVGEDEDAYELLGQYLDDPTAYINQMDDEGQQKLLCIAAELDPDKVIVKAPPKKTTDKKDPPSEQKSGGAGSGSAGKKVDPGTNVSTDPPKDSDEEDDDLDPDDAFEDLLQSDTTTKPSGSPESETPDEGGRKIVRSTDTGTPPKKGGGKTLAGSSSHVVMVPSDVHLLRRIQPDPNWIRLRTRIRQIFDELRAASIDQKASAEFPLKTLEQHLMSEMGGKKFAENIRVLAKQYIFALRGKEDLDDPNHHHLRFIDVETPLAS